MAFELRALRRGDDRGGFDCGIEPLNVFFRRYAHNHQFKYGISVTWVAADEERVAGFVTVTVTTVSRDAIPSARSLPPLPLPALLVGRLAVDASAKGQGVGERLLGAAIRAARAMHREVGCIGIIVDSKPDAVRFYERYGFRVIEEPTEEFGTAQMYLAYELIEPEA